MFQVFRKNVVFGDKVVSIVSVTAETADEALMMDAAIMMMEDQKFDDEINDEVARIIKGQDDA